jgi:hypothetical protein
MMIRKFGRGAFLPAEHPLVPSDKNNDINSTAGITRLKAIKTS